MSAQVRIDSDGLFLKGIGSNSPAVMAYLEGLHIWSFTPGADGVQKSGGTQIEWPAVLKPFLDGPAKVRLVAVGSDEVLCDVEHQFGTATERVAFVDGGGHPYAIDKMGHLTRSFEATSDEIKAEILTGTQVVIRELRERCRVEAYLGYGALLGAVREGGMIGHDSDTDIVYFSHAATPVDLIRETYRIERELLGLGWDVLRMSGGDLKVIWPLSDGRNCHIDVFSSFNLDGRHYMLGEHGEPFAVEDLLPLSTVTLDGFEFPAPRNPEAMLVYLYGESWRVPDPAFTPYIDPVVMDRLDGWLRGFRTNMGSWTPLLRGSAGPESPIARDGSEFAAWVEPQLAPGARIVELGAGNGRDAVWFTQAGHPVLATDYSRRSQVEVQNLYRKAKAKAAKAGKPAVAPLRARQLILNETRQVFHLIADMGQRRRHLYARQLLGCLDGAARENLYRLAASTLRGSDGTGPWSLWLEFSASTSGMSRPEPAGLVQRLDPDEIAAEIEAAGGVITYRNVAPGTDMFDNRDLAVARMRVTWPDTKEKL